MNGKKAPWPAARRRSPFTLNFRLCAISLIAVLMGLSHVLAAYAAAGDLDTTFSGDGKVATDFFGNSDLAYAVAIQPDGKIVAAGYANDGLQNDFALARYNPNGSLDPNFDGDGKVTTDFQGDDDMISAIAIQPNGKIVVAGSAVTTAGGIDFALARYNPDGSLDTNFSGNGKRATDFFGDIDQVMGLVIQPDGKIVAAGYTTTGTGDLNFALARYNSNGTLDTTFDGDGKLTTDFGSHDIANAVALQSDGKIVAAGSTGGTGTYDFALARYNTDGSLDSSFSFDGKASTDLRAAMTLP